MNVDPGGFWSDAWPGIKRVAGTYRGGWVLETFQQGAHYNAEEMVGWCLVMGVEPILEARALYSEPRSTTHS